MIRLGLAAGLSSLLLALVVTHFWTRPDALPSYQMVHSQWKPSYRMMVDRNGLPLGEIRNNFSVRRMNWVPYSELSPAIISVFVRAEDQRFWHHKGVDWLALLNAVRTNSSVKYKRGASTITMQLAAKLTHQHGKSRRRSIREKLRQIREARKLDRAWTKKQILETWLNIVDFRGEIQGIGAVSYLEYNKPPATITVAEAVGFAAMLPAPNMSMKLITERACTIAGRLKEPVPCETITSTISSIGDTWDPSTTTQLAFHVKQRLARTPGTIITTTLDRKLQEQAEKILADHLRRLRHRNVRDGAILVVDNESGDILAWVGTNRATSTARHVDGVLAKRQAGSSLKPHLYALAIESRVLNASSILDDSLVELESVQGIYAPQNYDRQFVGPVSARFALGNSMNIPAVKTLKLVGINAFMERLQTLGYEGLDQSADYYGFALALGSVEVSLYEQVRAYRSFARGGNISPIQVQPRSEPVASIAAVSPAAAYIAANILADPSARQHTFGRGNVLETPYLAGVKTGTSKAMRDNWCIGFTSKYTIGVWVGNFEGDSMTGVSGTTGAAPIWNELMHLVHQNQIPAPIPKPKGLVTEQVRFEPAIEAPREEIFLQGLERAVVHVATAEDREPMIMQPANDTVIALDPDIPAANQMVRFAVQGRFDGLQLLLDEQQIVPDVEWLPTYGPHTLRIRNQNNEVLDQVRFSVR